MLPKIWDFIKNQSIIWTSTTLLAIFTVFSQTIVDNIKTGLNKSDKRVTSLEKIAVDLSLFDFNAESLINNYYAALDSSQGNKVNIKNLVDLVNQYNNSIVTIRSNELIYRYDIIAYSKRKLLLFKTDVLEKYDSLFNSTLKLDSSIHNINKISINIAPLQGTDSNYIFKKTDLAYLGSVLPDCLKNLEKTKENTNALIKAFE